MHHYIVIYLKHIKPEVTKDRIYLETMAKVYPSVKQKIILDKELEGVLPLLPLGKETK